MSNFIGDIQMSNGLTDVFLNVLLLSGSAIAKTVSEKQLIVWLAEHDQSKMGMGAVGFDLCDIPWVLDTLEADKDFLLRVIAAAKSRRGWEQLDYRPNEGTCCCPVWIDFQSLYLSWMLLRYRRTLWKNGSLPQFP